MSIRMERMPEGNYEPVGYGENMTFSGVPVVIAVTLCMTLFLGLLLILLVG